MSTEQGTCYTVGELATLGEDNGELIGATYSTPWDAAMVRGCNCKVTHLGPFPLLAAWKGYDCSLRTCPTGDDPSTPNGLHEVQTIRCYATAGYFLLTFREIVTATDQLTDWPGIGIADTAADVRTAVKTMLQQATGSPPFAYAPNDVEVVMTKVSDGTTSTTACSATGVNIDVKFITHLGDLPMMIITNPSGTTSGSGSGAVYSGGAVTIIEKQVGTYEDAPCGNQGICGEKKGVCACLPGFDSSDGSEGPGLRGDCAYALPYPNVGARGSALSVPSSGGM